MEIGLNHRDWRNAAVSLEETTGESHPDWLGLRARFAAGIAARRAMAEIGSQGPAASSGSFDASSAKRMIAYEQVLAAVNRTVSPDGKGIGGISCAVAGNTTTGDRG